MIHLHTKFEINPSRNEEVIVYIHKHISTCTCISLHSDLWPYKRRNNEGSITKNNVCLQLPIIHIHTKFEKNPYRNTASRVETRTPTKCDLWPYISRNTGGSNTKNNRCLGCPMIHLHSKFEINPSRNEEVIVYTSIYAHVYPCTATFDPITDRTMRAASPKTIGVFIYP